MTAPHRREPAHGKELPGKRRYLPSAERKREILDAAFDEFSHRGFLATSLERIAIRAGISKSGIYAHYGSKDDIFEDMLKATLLPAGGGGIEPLEREAPGSLDGIVDRYIDLLHARLATPRALAVFRLLVTESGRVPELARYWGNKLVEQSLLFSREFFDAYRKQGLIRADVGIDDYLLAAAPSVQWLTLMLIFGPGNTPVSVEQIRSLHKQLLMAQLQRGGA